MDVHPWPPRVNVEAWPCSAHHPPAERLRPAAVPRAVDGAYAQPVAPRAHAEPAAPAAAAVPAPVDLAAERRLSLRRREPEPRPVGGRQRARVALDPHPRA